jgi:hypothetical protein
VRVEVVSRRLGPGLRAHIGIPTYVRGDSNLFSAPPKAVTFEELEDAPAEAAGCHADSIPAASIAVVLMTVLRS